MDTLVKEVNSTDEKEEDMLQQEEAAETELKKLKREMELFVHLFGLRFNQNGICRFCLRSAYRGQWYYEILRLQQSERSD